MFSFSSTSMDKDESHVQYALQLASASVLPLVLKAAIELGVLQVIGKVGPCVLLSSSEIASQLHSNNPQAPIVLDRVLCLLASHSILTCSSIVTHHNSQQINMLYGLAPVSKYFIPNQDGVSFAPMLEAIQDKVMVNMRYHLKDAIVEGGLPFNRAYGMNAFDYVFKDARCRDLFKAFMGDYNPMFMQRILEIYKGFEGLNSVVDVIKIRKQKMITVQFKSKKIRIEHVAGDTFSSIPKGDAIFMKIYNDLDDEHCLKILKTCYESLPDNGKVIVVEMVVPETPETSNDVKSGFQFDLFLMNMNPGGKERTKSEFESLAKEAEFSSIKVAARPTILH